MIDRDACTKIGFIAKPHGIHGEVNVRLLDDLFLEEISSEYLFLEIDGGLVPFFIKEIRGKSDNVLLVKFDGVDSDVKARRFVESSVYAYTNTLVTEPDEWSPSRLIGYMVKDVQFGEVGKITGINSISNNPLFEIMHNRKEVLIPINEDFVVEIDDKNKLFVINAPEGLIDLYLED